MRCRMEQKREGTSGVQIGMNIVCLDYSDDEAKRIENIRECILDSISI